MEGRKSCPPQLTNSEETKRIEEIPADMDKFGRHFIIPIARSSGWKKVCEIGASTGLTTDELLKLPLTSYRIIDPCFDAELALKYSGDARVNVQRSNSLDALPKLACSYDCILIDGDHNWFTVFNELRLIRVLSEVNPSEQDRLRIRVEAFQIGPFGWLLNIPCALLFGRNLRMLATIYMSDKWNYLWYAQHYEDLLRKVRRKRMNVLEIWDWWRRKLEEGRQLLANVEGLSSQ
jgi:hypothetical protein